MAFCCTAWRSGHLPDCYVRMKQAPVMDPGSARFLLVGEAPNQATEGQPKLWLRPDRSGIQHAGNRLVDLSGLSIPQLRENFATTNLLSYWPGRSPRGGDRWNKADARVWAWRRTEDWQGWLRVILLGRRVGDAFGCTRHKVNFYETDTYLPEDGDGVPIFCVVVPHPSGSNRWINNAERREVFRQFFQKLIKLERG